MIIVRENAGFDFWAHSAALEYVGWDELENYDEYLLCNDAYFGPIFPLEETFGEMNKRDCDFWGIMYNSAKTHSKSHGSIPFPEGHQKDYLQCGLYQCSIKNA